MAQQQMSEVGQSQGQHLSTDTHTRVRGSVDARAHELRERSQIVSSAAHVLNSHEKRDFDCVYPLGPPALHPGAAKQILGSQKITAVKRVR